MLATSLYFELECTQLRPRDPRTAQPRVAENAMWLALLGQALVVLVVVELLLF